MGAINFLLISAICCSYVLSYDLQSLANPFYEAFQEANNAINSYDCAETMFNSEFTKRVYDCVGEEIPQVSDGLIDCFDNQSLNDAIRSFCGKYSEIPYEAFQLKIKCMEQNIGRLDYNLITMKQLQKTFDTPYNLYYEACLVNTMKKEGVNGEISFNNKLQALISEMDYNSDVNNNNNYFNDAYTQDGYYY